MYAHPDIEKMGMWPTIQSLLSSDESSDAVRAAVLWIIGTAVQNNPAAQNAVSTLLDHDFLSGQNTHQLVF